MLRVAHVPICAPCALPSTTALTKPLMSPSLRRPPSRFRRISSGSFLDSGGASGGPWGPPRESSPGATGVGAKDPGVTGAAMALGLGGARHSCNLPPPCASLCDLVHLTPPSSRFSRPFLPSRPLCVCWPCACLRVWLPIPSLIICPRPVPVAHSGLARPATDPNLLLLCGEDHRVRTARKGKGQFRGCQGRTHDGRWAGLQASGTLGQSPPRGGGAICARFCPGQSPSPPEREISGT